MAKDDLTDQAREGYAADADATCPYLDTSGSANAWHVGRWLKASGRTQPRDVRAGRGYTVHANDMLLDVRDTRNVQRIN